jgi:hypothetical protein
MFIMVLGMAGTHLIILLSLNKLKKYNYCMTQFYTVLVINLILMILSIALIKTLYSNNLIDKYTRNTLAIMSILVPIGGLIMTVIKCRRIINHLARTKA